MRKKLLIFCMLLLVVAVGGSYAVIRQQLPKIPSHLQTALKNAGVEFIFDKFTYPERGLAVTFTGAKFLGDLLPVWIEAKELSLALQLSTWPPIKIAFHGKDIVVSKNQSFDEEKAQSTKAPHKSGIPTFIGPLLGLVQGEIALTNISTNEVEGLAVDANIHRIGLDLRGLPKARIDHAINVKRIVGHPWIPGVLWKGLSNVESKTIEALDHHIQVGPFDLILTGKYQPADQKWSAELSVPESNLNRKTFPPDIAPFIKEMSGTFGLKASLQGVGGGGGAKALISGEGKMKAADLRMDLNYPGAKGVVTANIDGSLTRNLSQFFSISASIDATQLELSKDGSFRKPAGVPMTLTLNSDGKDSQIRISNLKARFNNLNASSSGEFSSETPFATTMSFRISPTELSGWERFFPQFTELRTQGTIEMDGAFTGPGKEWREASLDLKLKARGIQMPILKDWMRHPELSIQGPVSLNSDTDIALSRGAIRTLQTKTLVDLAKARVKYGALFEKRENEALRADVVIESSGTRAEIRKGTILVGPMAIQMKGLIENFIRPLARIKFQSAPVEISRILAMSPGTTLPGISNLRGGLGLQGSVEGPLTSKETLPKISGAAILDKISLEYEVPATERKIFLQRATGSLRFTNNSLESSGLNLFFPHSTALLNFRLASFTEPRLTFQLISSRFALSDFYDLPKDGGAPGMLPVPAAQDPSKEDFRDNPWLKQLVAEGSISAKNVDLGYGVIDDLSTKISYDKLLLKVSPLTLKVFGGSILASTEWNGREKVPTTKQFVKADGVDANRFVSSYSKDAADILSGQLSSRMQLAFSGMSATEIRQSIGGSGDFSLKNGLFKTLKFTQKPLEALKKIPIIASSIQKTEWEERFNDVNGRFALKEGTLTLSNMIFRSDIFDLSASEIGIDPELDLNGHAVWYPKRTLVPQSIGEALRDENGKASLPLAISGTVKSPTVIPDLGILESRLKSYALRKAEEEKERAISSVKKKAEQEIGNKVKEGLQNIFK